MRHELLADERRGGALKWMLAGLIAVWTGGVSGADLTAALSADSRAEADRARDAGRRPAEVLAFLGIGEGMTVIDLLAAGGYYTEVLSLAVGPEGTVYAQNPAGMLRFRDGANDKAMTARLKDNWLANVVRLDAETDATGLQPGSLDAAITALNFHDIYNGAGSEAAVGVLIAVKALLKPGGVIGIIDHAGNASNDNSALHRIDETLVVEAVQAAGLVVDARSDVLRNSADDRSKGVFGPNIRGQTDRFVLRVKRPG